MPPGLEIAAGLSPTAPGSNPRTQFSVTVPQARNRAQTRVKRQPDPPPLTQSDVHSRVLRALCTARDDLLAERNSLGHWTGELSSSPLGTATATVALAVVRRTGPGRGDWYDRLIQASLEWLASNVNPDGGWGDTVLSHSNLSATALAWAAFGAFPGADDQFRSVVDHARTWIHRSAGGAEPRQLAAGILRRHAQDRALAVALIALSALAGRLGPGKQAWRWVLPLPFEVTPLPASWCRWLRPPMALSALPMFIAAGHARFQNLPPLNPIARLARAGTLARTLDLLAATQPPHGGFRESIVITSIVTASLAGSQRVSHPVVGRGIEFLMATRRRDGSWPLMSNMATAATTTAVNALAEGVAPADADGFTPLEAQRIVQWLLAQQHQKPSPAVSAAPGGWAWTDLPGAVPEAADTARALLALHHLSGATPRMSPRRISPGETHPAATLGVRWLLNLQNRDGGIPTFIHGSSARPMDRSDPDSTASTLRAWNVWRHLPGLHAAITAASRRAVAYLAASQVASGEWNPLWFGSQYAGGETNPTLGTAHALLALADLDWTEHAEAERLARRGVAWLQRTQRPPGSWGGSPLGPHSIEETAAAVEAMAVFTHRLPKPPVSDELHRLATLHGALWLCERVEDRSWRQPSPISLCYTRIWYYEKLNPMIATVAALGKVARWLTRAA